MAEREGFEPPERANAQRFSRPPLSTTQPPLRTEPLNKQDAERVQPPIDVVVLQVVLRILYALSELFLVATQ